MNFKIMFLKSWLLIGPLTINLGLAHGQKAILFSPTLQKAYPKIEIKQGNNEVWIRNVWFKEMENGFEFCAPGTKDSYLIVFSFMPERRAQKPVLVDAKVDKRLEWDSLFSWVSLKVNEYYENERFYSHSDILKYSSFKFFIEDENRILENKGVSFLEIYRYCPKIRIGSSKPDGITLIESKDIYSTKESLRIWLSYKTNLQELSRKLPLNQLKNGGPGLLKNSVSFWIINSLEFEDTFEIVNGKTLGKDSWFKSGFSEILFDSKRGVVGRTYGDYFLNEESDYRLFY